MEVRVFTEEDIDEINDWFDDRNEAGISARVLSRTGLIAPGVACGFLFATDSRICFLDFYISNPLAPKEERAAAFDEITRRLIEVAKERDYSLIFGASSHKSIQERCVKFGFTHQGSQEVYTMEIKK